MDAPNILCFVTDQHRADHLGCYGNPIVRTPNIDRLAREGMVFTESYVANPVCMPNRASLFTGCYPKVHGVRENGIALRPGRLTLPEVLRRRGYATASFGKIHLAPFGTPRGDDCQDYESAECRERWEEGGDLPVPYHGLEHVYLVGGHGHYAFGHYKKELDANHPGAFDKLQKEHALEPPTGALECWKASIPADLHYNSAIADKTIEYLGSRDRNRPFFVWCSFPDPHHPFSPPRPYCDLYAPESVPFAPTRREGEIDDLPPYVRACYEGRCETGGSGGDISQVTDNHYREIHALTYGMISMVDDSIGRVVAALEAAGDLDGTVILFLSDHGDLMGDHWLIKKGPFLFRSLVRVPTIWRLPGAVRPGVRTSARVSAVDLMPTLMDMVGVPLPDGVQGRSYRRVLSGEAGAHRDWTYIEYDESYLTDRLRQIRSPEWSLTYYANNDYGMLFDLSSDPGELHNLWDRPEYRSVKQDLVAELLRQSTQADGWLPPKRTHA
jgi:arylsulfatase